jgi:predicted ATPase
VLGDLQLGEFIYEQPTVGDTEYIFTHALTQEVSYNSILQERRKLLHERIGRAIEELYPSSIDDHLDELAHHYSRSGNSAKALDYLESAGLRAVRRLAYGEAMRNLAAALELLERTPSVEHAIKKARQQGAKSLELRATTSLARMLKSTDRRDEARAMLAEIYNWFTEGFDTADLKEAKVLLEEQQARPVLGEQR